MSTIDSNRIMSENGSSNQSVFSLNGLCYLINQDYSVYRVNGNVKEKIIDEPVGAFQIGEQFQRIFYQTEDRSLWTCTLDGHQKQRILGGNGDKVCFFTINNEYVFIVVEDKKEVNYLYQLNQNLQDATIIRQTNGYIRLGCADQQYLYYHFFDNLSKHTLVQHDIKTKKELILLENIGISQLQLYKNKLVMETYESALFPQDTSKIVSFDLNLKTLYTIAKVRAKEINCYLDHVFYVLDNSESIWTIPLEGGTPHQLWSTPVDILNLAIGCMFFIDCSDRSMKRVPLDDCTPDNKQGFPEAALESIEGNYILQENPTSYYGKTANDVLNELVPDYMFDREIYDYVVFLSLPHLNKHRENITALLSTGGYRTKSESTPILFVDGTTSHSRKKGFIIATDGIYTPNTFFPYDYTFTCERSGIQELTVKTYRRIRYNDTRRTLRLKCPMYKNGLDDVAALIEAVYVFSYFAPQGNLPKYSFPFPTKEPNKSRSFVSTDSSKSTQTKKITLVTVNSTEKATPPAPITKVKTEDHTKSTNGNPDETKAEKATSPTPTQRDFQLAMDALWHPETSKLICYNFCKFVLTTLWFTLWVSFFVFHHYIWSIVAIIGGFFLIWVVLISLQFSLQTKEMKDLEERFSNYSISTYYTPMGFRNRLFGVMLAVSFAISLLLSSVLFNLVLDL